MEWTDGTAYFTRALSYTYKILMKFIPGVNFVNILHALLTTTAK